MEIQLTPEEVRVLGALIEKQNTTPDYYPLTMNGLVTACNQKTSRDPVVNYNEALVLRVINSLRDRQLALQVHLVDGRVPKYEQNLDKKLGLTQQEMALLAVLMLRGPQTVGELRARCARLYPFDSLDEVEIGLEALTEHEPPLAKRLALQPGRKEHRFAHLLGDPQSLAALDEAEAAMAAAAATGSTGEATWAAAAHASDGGESWREPMEELREEVSALRQELADMKHAFETFKHQFE